MMRSILAVSLTTAMLWVAPVALRPGDDSAATVSARDLGRGELIGKVVNTSSRFQKRRLQVRVGQKEWTLHVPEGAPVMRGRKRASVHELDLGTYVRAIGRRIGTTRLRAERMYIIGDRLALQRSGYGRTAGGAGYFASYAGYRSEYRR